MNNHEGWKLVPVEPTDDMMFRAEMQQPRNYRDLYKAMLDAAPTPPVAAEATSAERVRSEPEIEHAVAYFQFDKLADGTMYYEQVEAKYRNDADVIPLYARLPEPMMEVEWIREYWNRD
ncbi:MAG: hypothetical protein WC121_11980 [Candidatus Kapaibacterium sp.]|jgi:hypothetical protein